MSLGVCWEGQGSGVRRSWTPHSAVCTSGRTGRERRTWRTGELGWGCKGQACLGALLGQPPHFPSFLQGRDGPPGIPGPPGPPGPKVITPALP